MPSTSVSKEHHFFLRQVLVASVAFLEGINAGAILGFTSILFAQLKDSEFLTLSQNEESWLASIPAMAMVPFCACSCWILRACGRKKVELGSNTLSIFGWLFVYFGYNYELLFAGRCLQGVYLGVGFPVLLTFVGEISSPCYRSTFLTLIPLGSMIGVFLVQLLAEYCSWRTTTWIFISFSIYNMLVISLSSDSYVTYLEANKLQEAENSFYYYQGGRVSTQYKFEEILNALPPERSVLVVLKECATKSFLVPFGITTLVYVTNELSASQAVSFYTAQIVALITTNATFQYYSILFLNILRIIAVIATPFLVRKSSVRTMLLISGFMLSFTLLVMALMVYLAEVDPSNRIYQIVTLVLLVASAMFFGVGLGPLAPVVCGEMFPPMTRVYGCAWSTALSFLLLFIVVKFMPAIIVAIGIHWTFFVFGGCTLFGISICYFVVPYTHDKTLQEINELYVTRDLTRC